MPPEPPRGSGLRPSVSQGTYLLTSQCPSTSKVNENPVCPQTKLVFEPVHRSDGKLPRFKARIVTKRNGTRLNNHQRIQLQGWRANCDIQVVIDQYACIEYLLKYAAKGEPKSPMLTETFDIVMKNTDNNSDAQKTMNKIAMRTLGQRDFSAHETMHLLFSLKLYSTTF